MFNRKKKILIADDEKDLTWSMSRHIQRASPDTFVCSAVNGLQAFELFQSIHPDLLISDLRLPGMNGFKLIEMAKQYDPAIKVIVISAFYSRDIEQRLGSLHIDGFLEKPFDLKRLCELSDALLSAGQPELIDSS